MKKPKLRTVAKKLDQSFPNLAGWVQDGLVEIGCADYSRSFIRALDQGGTVWEGKRSYPSLEAALKDADKGIAEWLEENG